MLFFKLKQVFGETLRCSPTENEFKIKKKKHFIRCKSTI